MIFYDSKLIERNYKSLVRSCVCYFSKQQASGKFDYWIRVNDISGPLTILKSWIKYSLVLVSISELIPNRLQRSAYRCNLDTTIVCHENFNFRFVKIRSWNDWKIIDLERSEVELTFNLIWIYWIITTVSFCNPIFTPKILGVAVPGQNVLISKNKIKLGKKSRFTREMYLFIAIWKKSLNKLNSFKI